MISKPLFVGSILTGCPILVVLTSIKLSFINEYACIRYVGVFRQQVIVQAGFVIDHGLFFLIIFLFRCLSFLVPFYLLGSKWWRKCPIFTEALSTISLVVFRGSIAFFYWSDFYLFGIFFFNYIWLVHSVKMAAKFIY